jgi:DNA-directed RNA polymerase specialized sigma24 family protein
VLDPPLPVEHLRCILREFSRLIQRRIRTSLAKLPLGRLFARLRGRCPAGVPLPVPSAVRSALARDEQLIDDATQEVAIAVWRALQRGRIRAARPCVYSWLCTVVPRVARRVGLRAAPLLMVAARGEDDVVVDAPASYCFGAGHLNAVCERDRYARLVVVRPSLVWRLSTGERTVFAKWLQGERCVDIARELGLSAGAVRLRLLRARRLLDRVSEAT